MLNKAAQMANVSGIKLLLEQGVKPNRIDRSGRTPLINCCLNSDFPAKRCKIIKLLLQRGADVNIANKQGKTALILAIDKANIEIVKTLLAAGAAVNARDQQGRTALLTLMTIPYYRNPQSLLLLELLLKYKSDLKVKDNNDASALLLALGHQQKPIVIKRLLGLNLSINSLSKNRVSPLMLAARHYDAEIVDLLLKRGAKVNATDDTGWTPLMYAAEYWPLQRGCCIYPVPVCRNRKAPQESIKLLIKHGAKVNVSDKYGNTSLIEAANWADADTLKLLLTKHKSLQASLVNTQNVGGHTALMCAVAHNPDDKAIKVLIDAGAKCEVNMNRGRYPRRNKRKIADGLVSTSKQSYEWIDPPLFVAVAKGRKAIVKALLKNGADPNWQYSIPFSKPHKPLRDCKDIAIATLLINAGAIKSSLDSSTSSNLLSSIKYQKFEQAGQSAPIIVLEKMLNTLKFQNKKTRKQMLNRAQRCAVRSNNLKVVKWLFKKGARFTQSIIINAVENADNPEVLKYLLKHGLTTKYRTNYDYRAKGALHFACSAEIVDILIKNGMNVNERAGKNRRGLTPLQTAISRPWHQHSWRRAAVVEALLKHGAKLEQTDPDGRTALLIAFSQQYLSPDVAVVKILLNYGAKVNAKDRQGHTALNRAVDKNNCYFTDMLLTAGADKALITQKELNKACPYIKRKIEQAYGVATTAIR
jgi:ankyrin repeat protein